MRLHLIPFSRGQREAKRLVRMAESVASWSVCDRKHVGAAVFRADWNEMVSSGYNYIPDMVFSQIGIQPTACDHCSLVCPRAAGVSRKDDYSDCPAVHAEVAALNALSDTDRMYANELIMAVTAPPCRQCAELIAMEKSIGLVIWKRTEGVDDHVPDPSEILTDKWIYEMRSRK